jgi:hypothetical protein
VSHVYCPECGFQNPETANFCAKCGSALVREAGGETTMSMPADETPEELSALDETIAGPALVVRSGGGRAGETFRPADDRTLIGRSPDCDIFLDDVTVSRRHAELLANEGRFTIRDLGSLNGTFVNRRRIESVELEDDDEVQIGKYRMTFLRP